MRVRNAQIRSRSWNRIQCLFLHPIPLENEGVGLVKTAKSDDYRAPLGGKLRNFGSGLFEPTPP